MAFKNLKKNIYMEPVEVTAEAVGSGDGTTTEYSLAHTTIRDGTLTVKLDGTTTTAYTVVLATGVITFTTAPAVDVAITADYTAGYVSEQFTATGETVVIGLQLANVSAADAAVSVRLGDFSVCKDVGVPTKASYAPVSGKLVLVAGDKLHVTASADNTIDMVLSYMEVWR